VKKAITVRLLDPTGHDTTGGRSTRPLIKFVHRLNIRMIISFLLHWSAGGPRDCSRRGSPPKIYFTFSTGRTLLISSAN